MKNSFTRNLQIGFGLSLLLLVASSIASYLSITSLLKSTELVNHTNLVIRQVEDIISTLKDAETGQRGFLLTNDPKFLEPYNGSQEKVVKALNTLKALTKDNPIQQKNIAKLSNLLTTRFTVLKQTIDKKRYTNTYIVSDLEKGKIYMDQARSIVGDMIAAETQLLNERTASMNTFSSATPVFIIIAAILSIIISLVSYLRVRSDYLIREKLQGELIQKDKDITNRIDIIQTISEKISLGDYQIRINDEEKDGLGVLAFHLNKMAESLQFSFTQLSNKEWIQAGIVELNERMFGDKDLESLTANIINFVTTYSGSHVGALYLKQDSMLELTSSYALVNNGSRNSIKIGEGLVGQCVLDRKEILLSDFPEDSLSINFASGQLRPKNILAFPLYHETNIKGAIELASVTGYSDNQITFLKEVSKNIGTVINTAQNRKKLQEFLEETQAQSEELQAQHSELENLNAELEAQSQKLQASEEELRVQQEELLQANSELEERTLLLEQKNQVIIERNLDIQKKAEELELSTKYKSEFLANMSHELRTPLNSILLLSRLLSENHDENLTNDQIEFAQVIQTSGNGLLNLIDEILDLSKIESGKMELEYEEIPIVEIVNDMKSLFAPLAKDKGLELNFNTDDSAPSKIETDKMRLEQIIKNLVSNALKFTSKGSININIKINDEGFIEFTVIDTGIGIAKSKQHLIFEAFQQEDGSTRRKYGGTGLGLSISKELAKLLGGDLKLKSEAGQGSEFTVFIPTKKPEIKLEQSPVSYTPSPVVQEEKNIQDRKRYLVPTIPKDIIDDRDTYQEGDKVILIVEDDTAFAKSLLDFSRQKGYKGIVAVRGDLGIEMAFQYKPIAILLDIQLPVKDGWEVMEDLKANSQTRHIPVHIMSSIEVKKESLLKGAVDFINKPIAIEHMQQIFGKLEEVFNKGPRKVLIVEENSKHAKALAYYLETSDINAEIKNNIQDSADALQNKDVDCVILDMGIPGPGGYETLEVIKKDEALKDIPIIIFTGKNLSKTEEIKIKQYADSIVIKTAHSYQRILDEVALFLHLIEEKRGIKEVKNRLGVLNDVLKNKTVLVADDDVRNIYSLTKALEQHKMKVLSAIDGKEALRQLEENPNIDIVLMDMMMPELDGYETTTHIRQDPRFKNIPVLAVTAKAMIGDREKCISAGASDYISKPVDIDQLTSLLRVWLYDKAM